MPESSSNPFPRMLVQVDPTHPLKRSAEFASHLAHTFNSELVLLYVVDEQIAGMMGSDMYTALENALSSVGHDALDTFEHDVGGGVKMTKCVGYGDTASTVAKFVIREGAHLAITGGYHHSVYQRIPFGSVVNEIIRRNPASTLLIRDNHPIPQQGRPVLVPFDGSKSSLRGLFRIAPFAARLGMPLHVVNFQPRTKTVEGERLLAEVEEVERKLKIPIEKRVVAKPFFRRLSRAILTEAHRIDAGLVALSRTGSTGAGRASPVVEALVIHTNRPLLVVEG